MRQNKAKERKLPLFNEFKMSELSFSRYCGKIIDNNLCLQDQNRLIFGESVKRKSMIKELSEPMAKTLYEQNRHSSL